MNTQTDLYGNPIKLDPHDERILMFMSEYTRFLLRQIKMKYGIDMLEAMELGAKQLAVTLEKTNILTEGIDTIKESTDKDEIAYLLKNLFEYLN